MNKGIANLTVIPLRESPAHKSQMVSQLLFGESFSIIDTQDEWIEIRCDYDGYNGWIDANQVIQISNHAHQQLQPNNFVIGTEVIHLSECVYKKVYVPFGSPLAYFKQNKYSSLGEMFTYYGSIYEPDKKIKEDAINEVIKENALKFLNAPYLWGGRTVLGIDCSGFSQIIFKSIGIKISRDAKDQADEGQLKYFLHEAKIGDLAFFDNEEQDITHVGILLSNHQIIHAHGQVRIDSIDQHGIYNNELKKYSHKLRLVKSYR